MFRCIISSFLWVAEDLVHLFWIITIMKQKKKSSCFLLKFSPIYGHFPWLRRKLIIQVCAGFPGWGLQPQVSPRAVSWAAMTHDFNFERSPGAYDSFVVDEIPLDTKYLNFVHAAKLFPGYKPIIMDANFIFVERNRLDNFCELHKCIKFHEVRYFPPFFLFWFSSPVNK